MTGHRKAAYTIALLLTDAQRSVARVATERNWHNYSPFGYKAKTTTHSTAIGFNGERLDPLTGHYWLGDGYRVFNTLLSRFQSPDSLSPFREGGLNCYIYCAADPVNKADPTGHAPVNLLNLPKRIRARFTPRSPRKVTPLHDLLARIKLNTATYETLGNSGALDGRIQSFPDFTRPPRQSKTWMDSERISMTKPPYPFENDLPEMRPLAIRTADGKLKLQTEKFDKSIHDNLVFASQSNLADDLRAKAKYRAGVLEAGRQEYIISYHDLDFTQLSIVQDLNNSIRTAT